jgi:tetratricopeptide (TPR) repeat protein
MSFSRLSLWFAAATCLLPTREVRAEDPTALTLTRHVRELAGARGPAMAVAAQELWASWRLDGTGVVTRALKSAASDATRDPYERAYAQWLTVLARRRLGDTRGAERLTRELAYADDWMVLGPFENRENQGFDEALVPELEEGRPVAVSRTFSSKGKLFGFRHVDRAAPFGALDFSELDTSEGGACWYAVARVKASSGASFDGRVSLGTAGAVKVFVDGAVVGSDAVERGLDPERHAFPLHVEPQGSRLVVKVCHRSAAPALMLRVADADGRPTSRLSLEGSPEIALAAKKASGRVAPKGDAGFLAHAEAAAPRSVQDTRTLRRYLMLTGGDDARGLRLRDLTAKLLKESPAADDALARVLLAGTRAERHELLEQAARLAKTQEDLLEVDLLRIDLQRTGLAPSEALPMARALAALYPDDPRVIAALADVEAQLGLGASAAERLSAAVERHGPIPLLVESAASQLGNAGRREESARMILLGLARANDRLAWHRERLAWALAAGEREVARGLVDRIDAITGQSPNVAIELAVAELRLGHVAGARDRLTKAAERRPSDARFWVALADLELGSGHREEAVAALERGVEIAPEDTTLRRRLEALTPAGGHEDESFAKSEVDIRKLGGATRSGSRRTLARVHVTTVYPTGLTAGFDQIAFQPLTDEAALEAREYSFGYDAARQVVQVRRARVLRPDGTSLEAVDIAQANTDDPSVAMYSSQRAVIVHFPRIAPGDIVEVSWRTDSLGGDEALREAFGETFGLQTLDATLVSEWILRHPTARPIRVTTTGPREVLLEESVKGETREVRVRGENLPVVTLEASGPPFEELVPRVVASGFPTWESVGSWYRRFVAHDLVADEALRRRARALGEGQKDVVDKVRAVYDWVVQSTRYVALEFGVHGYEPYPTWEVAQRGWGDCKDKASLIVVLLRELGVEAEMVLLRTNPHGRRYEGIPTHAIFDHAIAYVPALDLYLDGTAENTGMRELPWMDRGAVALRITPEGGRLVTLPDTAPEETFERSEAKLFFDARGSLELGWSGHVEGALAHDWRVRYGAEGTRKGRLEDDLGATFTGLRLESVTGGSLDDRQRGPSLEAHGTSDRFAAKQDQGFAVPVAPSPFLESSYAGLESRTSTLWFARRPGHESSWELRLPAAAHVDDVPRSVHLETPFARFDRTVQRDGGSFVVTTKWALTRSHVEPAEYAAFREFCRQVDRASAERLRWRIAP